MASSTVQVRQATQPDLGVILLNTNVAINKGHSHFGPRALEPARRLRLEGRGGVYVDVGAQRQGVDRALHEVLIPTLDEAGVRAVLAGVALPNWASIALHEALGFKQAKLPPRMGSRDGAWGDVGCRALYLGGDGPPQCPGADR